MCRTGSHLQEQEVDAPFQLDGPPEMILPIDEVNLLSKRQKYLSRSLLMVERVPLACGVLQNFQFLGVFPTSRWLADGTMPADVKELFGGTPFFPLGEYRVAKLDLLDGSGKLHPLILVVNKGVNGLLTGYWGGAFSREADNTCWARFETTGELETTVIEHHLVDHRGKALSRRSTFQEFDGLEFWSNEYLLGENDVELTLHHRPTQLERFLGIAAEFVLSLDCVTWLPDALVEIRDRSGKLERRRRATRRTISRSLSRIPQKKAYIR